MADSKRYQLIRQCDQIDSHISRALELADNMFIMYAEHDKEEAIFLALLSKNFQETIRLLREFRSSM